MFSTAQSYNIWRKIVEEQRITGALCHDANQVAVALAEGVDQILTYDVKDFRKIAAGRITIAHPLEM